MDFEEKINKGLLVVCFYAAIVCAVILTIVSFKLATGEEKPCSVTATQGN